MTTSSSPSKWASASRRSTITASSPSFPSRRPFQNPEFTDPQLSFQLAQIVPDLEFRQELLASRSEAERMESIAKFLGEWVPRHRRTLHARTIAPLNGHGKSSEPL